MREPIQRIEVHLNGSSEPLVVLEHPPYSFRLDTRTLPEGRNVLEVQSVFVDGRRSRREISFEVQNTAGILVEGLDGGATVRDELDLTVLVAGERPTVTGLGAGVGVVAIVALLATVWGLFVTAVPMLPAEAASAGGPAASGKAPTAATVPVDQAFLKAGADLYAQHCATCHQTTGKGIPAAFPPLAGNSNLSDIALIIDTVHSGHSGKITVNGKAFDQTMPAFGAGFSSKQLAEVATYVRNSWGNAFGGVTEQDAEAALAHEPAGAVAGGPAKAVAGPAPVDGALLKEGEGLYKQHCATCHQTTGKGIPAAFPPLAGNPNLSDAALIIATVHSGHSGKITVNGKAFDQTMPAIGVSFGAEQLAAVATYVRNTWGNHFGGVTVAEAANATGQGKSGD